MGDVFISYGNQDGDWVEALAVRLEDAGIRVYFARWDLDLSMVPAHELDDAISRSTHAIQVLSPHSLSRPWVREEYAALLNQSVHRGLRFIPVIYGDVEVPPFAANRVALDFRRAGAEEYEAKVADLVRALRGEPRRRGTGAVDAARAAFAAPERPLVPPAEPSLVLCHVPADAGYGERLAGQLRAEGLPVWSVGDLLPGDDHVWTVRQQLRHAAAVVVLMSAESEASDDLLRMVLEGQRHSRPFVPVLLGGDRHYHLANSWYFDARGGVLPGPAELALLRELSDAARTGQPPPVLPTPSRHPATAVVRVPAAVALDRLHDHLARRELDLADLVTTSLLLAAADRLDSGWLRASDADRLPADLLAGVDELWSRFSAGRLGFGAQRSLGEVSRGRHADFLALSVRCGWRTGPTDAVPKYREFTRRAVGRPAFFPTLRNPQSEHHLDWYEQWTRTALAVHLRLRQGS